MEISSATPQPKTRTPWETEPFARIPPRESRGSCGWGTSGNDGFSTIKYRGKPGFLWNPTFPPIQWYVYLQVSILCVCMYNVCMNICQVHKCSISQNALWLRKSWDLGLFHLQTKPWMYMVSTPKKIERQNPTKIMNNNCSIFLGLLYSNNNWWMNNAWIIHEYYLNNIWIILMNWIYELNIQILYRYHWSVIPPRSQALHALLPDRKWDWWCHQEPIRQASYNLSLSLWEYTRTEEGPWAPVCDPAAESNCWA